MDQPRDDESQDARRHEEDAKHHPFEKGRHEGEESEESEDSQKDE